MLGFCCRWQVQQGSAPIADDARRLAASLTAGIGGSAGFHSDEHAAYAYRSVRDGARAMRAWRPATPSPTTTVLFHGHLANAGEIAAVLGVRGADSATLYGHAVERWGMAADRRLIGEYCAIVYDQSRPSVRLSRSPLRAPPLHYFRSDGWIVAASVPRSIFALGVPALLDDVRIADSNWLNFSDETASWYRGLARVGLGCVVEVGPSHFDQCRYYDITALPEVRLPRVSDYLDQADELFDRGVQAALEGAVRPGATLSGGLDSPQVAVRALKQLPLMQTLPCFTFVPEPGWDGIVPAGMTGDEEATVRAFGALHPRLDLHFTANQGIAHDHRWAEMFQAMGVAPSGMCNMYMFHGILSQARDVGCDRLLLAEWGNSTFSAKGEWGFVEYLLRGRWRQLFRALRDHPHDPRSLLRRFVALSLVPLLPDPLWRALMRVWHPSDLDPLELISPLSRAYRESAGVERRARKARVSFSRYQPTSRRDAIRKLFSNGDSEAAEVYQGFEQLYGIELRDPTAYRPFVEFCLGLPTDLFLRDGKQRWLAKELAREIMPEDQRKNRENGRWDADWHQRIGRRRSEWLADLERASQDERKAGLIDFQRLSAALAGLPSTTSTDPQEWMPVELGVPRGLLTARFIDFVERRNDH